MIPEYSSNFDLRYEDRYAMFNIYIIRAGNAFMLITLPLIFFYKIRFLPKMNQYVPRFFLSLKAILPITMILFSIFAFLYYAYTILTKDLSYNLGDTEKDLPDDDEHFYFVRIMDYINLVYRSIFEIIVILIVALFFQFIGSSIT